MCYFDAEIKFQRRIGAKSANVENMRAMRTSIAQITGFLTKRIKFRAKFRLLENSSPFSNKVSQTVGNHQTSFIQIEGL